jgi:DivIVA domain-containing protein
MGTLFVVFVVLLVLVALAFGVMALLSGEDPGLAPAEPDGRSVPLPTSRPLAETDIEAVRFDTSLRGYRMEQVDRALRRAAYDVGYKDEMISVLEAEVDALRDGRTDEAEQLRQARESARRPAELVESGFPVVAQHDDVDDLDAVDTDADSDAVATAERRG